MITGKVNPELYFLEEGERLSGLLKLNKPIYNIMG